MGARARRGALLGLLVAMLGGTVGLSETGLQIEEEIGLRWLFTVRGPVAPPSEPVIIAVDSRSAELLGQPRRLRHWQRSLHARLIDELVRRGAEVVIFDMFFEQAKDAQGDERLATAIAESGRIVLTQSAQTKHPDGLVLNTLLDPTPALADAATALAPFPLPKVSSRVSRFWAFFSAVDETPTLPVAALHLYVQRRLGTVLLREAIANHGSAAVHDQDGDSGADVGRSMQQLRRALRGNPALAERLAERGRRSASAELSAQQANLLETLLYVYAAPPSHYLNLYGPARTITTHPYHWFLDHQPQAYPVGKADIAGRVVFVGESETLGSAQTDAFYTVYSGKDGVDLSGVEIAATAFANLLHGHTLRPLSMGAQLVVLLLYGFVIGFLCVALSGIRAVMIVTAIACCAAVLAQVVFNRMGLWAPVVTPFALQLPFALIAGLIWNYGNARREREQVTQAVRQYIPEPAARRVEAGNELGRGSHLVYATLLATDVADYTTQSERLEPRRLADLSNDYFDAVAGCVTARSGIIVEITGDALMCAWTADQHNVVARGQACRAALEIRRAVDRFNELHEQTPFPTRVGLHSGWVAAGNVGGGGRLQYSYTGDATNTAARIEGLNKYLRTGALASLEVIEDLEGILVRRVGDFVLKGKTRAITICEIVAEDIAAERGQRELCRTFEQARLELEAGRWASAIRRFRQILEQHPHDGPSCFLLQHCERMQCSAPLSTPSSVIHIRHK